MYVAIVQGGTGRHHDRPAHRAGRPGLELEAGRISILAWWRAPRCGSVTRVGPLRIVCRVPCQQRNQHLLLSRSSKRFDMPRTARCVLGRSGSQANGGRTCCAGKRAQQRPSGLRGWSTGCSLRAKPRARDIAVRRLARHLHAFTWREGVSKRLHLVLPLAQRQQDPPA